LAAPFFFGNCGGRIRGFDPGVPGGFEAGGAVSNPHALMSMADAAIHRRPSQSGGFAPGGTIRSSRGYDGLESAQGNQGDGRPHREAGGLVQQVYQCSGNADLAQLARLAVMFPPTSIEGQIIRRVLMAKRMALAAKAPLPQRPSIFGLGATQADLTSQVPGGFAPISGGAQGFEAGGAIPIDGRSRRARPGLWRPR
jgi:hypothetical protein